MKRITTFNDFLNWQHTYHQALMVSEEADLRSVLSDIRQQLRDKGDEALINFAKQFDGVDADFSLKVTNEELKAAYQDVSSHYVEALKRAIENIRAFHSKQIPHN